MTSAIPELLSGLTRTRNRRSVSYATPGNRTDWRFSHETEVNRSDVYSAGGSRIEGMFESPVLLNQVFPSEVPAGLLFLLDIEGDENLQGFACENDARIAVERWMSKNKRYILSDMEITSKMSSSKCSHLELDILEIHKILVLRNAGSKGKLLI